MTITRFKEQHNQKTPQLSNGSSRCYLAAGLTPCRGDIPRRPRRGRAGGPPAPLRARRVPAQHGHIPQPPKSGPAGERRPCRRSAPTPTQARREPSTRPAALRPPPRRQPRPRRQARPRGHHSRLPPLRSAPRRALSPHLTHLTSPRLASRRGQLPRRLPPAPRHGTDAGASVRLGCPQQQGRRLRGRRRTRTGCRAAAAGRAGRPPGAEGAARGERLIRGLR